MIAWLFELTSINISSSTKNRIKFYDSNEMISIDAQTNSNEISFYLVFAVSNTCKFNSNCSANCCDDHNVHVHCTARNAPVLVFIVHAIIAVIKRQNWNWIAECCARNTLTQFKYHHRTFVRSLRCILFALVSDYSLPFDSVRAYVCLCICGKMNNAEYSAIQTTRKHSRWYGWYTMRLVTETYTVSAHTYITCT